MDERKPKWEVRGLISLYRQTFDDRVTAAGDAEIRSSERQSLGLVLWKR
jgi:hypothetical protein